MREGSLILICLLFHIKAFTQKKFSLPFFSNYYREDAPISFGIQYNYVYQNYQIQLKDNWQQDYPIDYYTDHILYLGSLKSIHSKAGSGFSVGVPIDIRVNKLFYVNLTPSYLFVNNLGIQYESLDNKYAPLIRKSKHQQYNLQGENFNAFELPFIVKLRSEEKVLKNKVNRYRAFITAGIRYTKWLGLESSYKTIRRKQDNNSSSLILKPDYFSWEAGLGLDIFFESFKISPELKFNQSFNNVMDNNNILSTTNKFMNPIDKAFIRNISFGLTFQ